MTTIYLIGGLVFVLLLAVYGYAKYKSIAAVAQDREKAYKQTREAQRNLNDVEIEADSKSTADKRSRLRRTLHD